MARPHWTEQDLEAARRRMGRCGVEHVEARQPHKLKEASSTLAPATTYRSKWEVLYAAKMELEKRAGAILDYRYEPCTVFLEDPVRGRRRKFHRPDFWVLQLDRTLRIVAVKGYHKNIRDSLTLIRWAAQRFPFGEWWITWYKDGIWDEVHT